MNYHIKPDPRADRHFGPGVCSGCGAVAVVVGFRSKDQFVCQTCAPRTTFWAGLDKLGRARMIDAFAVRAVNPGVAAEIEALRARTAVQGARSA